MSDQPDQPDQPEVLVLRPGDEQGRGGLYNMVVPGGFERAAICLPLVDINPDGGHLFRLRDAWVEKDDDGPVIHVYTRVGGGNRNDYADVIEALRGNENYLRDADDRFDATYASFWFRVPEKFAKYVEDFAVAPVDTGKRWREIAARLASAGGD